MTCIAGIVENGEIYIGADSAGSNYQSVFSRADEKVFVNGPMLFGFTSSFRMGQLLQYKLVIPKQPKNSNDFEYMTTTFIDAVRTCLKEGGFSKVKDNEEVGGTFLVGYNKNLYLIEEDFQVANNCINFNATGCGYQFALGSLYESKDSNKSPEARIKGALEVSSLFSPYVQPPFVIKSIS